SRVAGSPPARPAGPPAPRWRSSRIGTPAAACHPALRPRVAPHVNSLSTSVPKHDGRNMAACPRPACANTRCHRDGPARAAAPSCCHIAAATLRSRSPARSCIGWDAHRARARARGLLGDGSGLERHPIPQRECGRHARRGAPPEKCAGRPATPNGRASGFGRCLVAALASTAARMVTPPPRPYDARASGHAPGRAAASMRACWAVMGKGMQPKPASPANLLALPEGTELVGEFRIKRVLGAGGFGITYLASETALARDVTIKEYFPVDYAARSETGDVSPRSLDSAEDYAWGLERFM